MTQAAPGAAATWNPEGAVPLTRQRVVFPIAISLAATLVAILQSVRLVYAWHWDAPEIAALALAAGTVLLARRVWKGIHGRALAGLLVLLLAQAGLLFLALLRAGQPGAPRLVLVAIVVLTAAIVLSVVLTGAKVLAPLNTLLLMFSIAVGIFLAESALQLVGASAADIPSGPVWSGAAEPHPLLGYVYAPFSVMKTYYPDNARGYFREEKYQDPREWRWQLQVVAGSAAKLEMDRDDSAMVRIAIAKANPDVKWDIQLNLPHLRVKLNHKYTVSLRARADRPRSIVMGFARASEPRTNLGLYQSVELTPEWRDVKATFTATASDTNARLHFDVAGSDIPVDLSTVSLHHLPDGQSVEPDLPPKKFFVRYDFNGRGCRGPDYAVPHPKGTTRILALGDSFTMGVGVHEEDTFARQLERMLKAKVPAESAGSPWKYEVINCGVSGYGTRDERLFYQLVGAGYQPDVVMLVMVWNDDLSYLEEVKKGYLERRPGELEKLFYLWGRIQVYRHQRRTFDFSKCVADILQLDHEVRQQGARLAVVAFRIDSLGSWPQLISTVAKGLEGTDIPFLDLGPALMRSHPYEDLIVHPVDQHPNQFAHEAAAEEILSFLQGRGLLRSR